MDKKRICIRGHEFQFSTGQVKYIELRQRMQKIYHHAYAQAADEFFDKFKSINDILKNATAWFGALIITPIAKEATAFLISEKHYDLTVDAFIEECIDLHYWQKAIEFVIEKKLEIDGEEEERERQRSARTAVGPENWTT